MKPSRAMTNYIEELLFKMNEFKKIASGDIELTRKDGTALQQLRKYENAATVVTAVQDVYESMDEEKQAFVRNYYWSSGNQTLKRAADQLNYSERTMKRWKEEVATLIANRLGWL
ncbi:hypothetical protein [Planococcus beigongshangi]|uniref:hypothetical protein n=1 Tax=Planococcus beigongshangi TaxID=2782536 RepID=UPI00193B2123|nr:hypothetical protein [Planococcus beigongshangi]